MSLNEYKNKRSFEATSEPAGATAPRKTPKSRLRYVIQKHRASHLHYDFRLEWKGVLLSWAVPRGPSLDPSIKRLAMQVEDHPVEYADFEGVIPEGEYGGGTVMIWDTGTWTPEQDDVDAAISRGDLKFTLHGKKLNGSWVLVRTNSYGRTSGKSWLLIKHRDQYASTNDLTADEPRSAVSKRLLAEIARDGGGNVEKAATGDPIEKIGPIKKPNAIKKPASVKKHASAKELAPVKKTQRPSRTVQAAPPAGQRRKRVS
ncbi:MAG TPA: DNA polymerase ligase N-terminal domain-containing protein [Candidatus Dormibacteraeota bacterium]|nr:DNA polymerase ligase N-terminal domain-containing protein [Candidatus Dormibacteraeota bacterium]